jgi:uncharacterized protein YdeI (YjbR/CyaY-like superfamily)
MQVKIAGGTAHQLPDDLKEALNSDKAALLAWQSLTPLARNEWICWTVSVKKDKTRKDHIRRTISELKAGMRRPCCWIGCVHRKDKPASPSQKFILSRRREPK